MNLLKECEVKSSDSCLWKSLASLWPDIVKQIAWECRDGGSIKFWSDLWLDDDCCLFDKVVRKPVGRLANCNVAGMVNERGEWMQIFLKDYLADRELLRLRASPTPVQNRGQDVIRWRGGSGSKYSISDMY